jgi:hypothetical protein
MNVFSYANTGVQLAYSETVIGYWWVKAHKTKALFFMFLAYLVHLLIEGCIWLGVFLILSTFF